MKRFSMYMTAIAAGLLGSMIFVRAQPAALAHCEVPCGIYTDHMRIHMMLEDTQTIDKAVAEITRLMSDEPTVQQVNQISRWITNKEEHATKIQQTIAQYFMHQRIKPVERGGEGWDDYVTRLTQHHAVMVNAMKTKQTVDSASVATLRDSINAIAGYYPDPEHHDHDHDHSHGG